MHGGASITTLGGATIFTGKNFWVTERGDMTHFHPMVKNSLNMNINEHSFYQQYTRKQAPSQTNQFFQNTKRQTLDHFMKAKYGSAQPQPPQLNNDFDNNSSSHKSNTNFRQE